MEIKLGVKEKLKAFGYVVPPEDESILDLFICVASEQIKAYTNLGSVPEGLNGAWIDMVCAMILRTMLTNGKIENIGKVVKSIQEGDTNVTFDESLTPEKQLLKCIDAMSLDETMMARYRVMLW